MKFGDVPVDEAAGAILAHSLRAGAVMLKKGLVLSTNHIAALRGAGFTSVTVARLEPDDLDENAAAARLATVLAGENVSLSPAATGRVNLYAEQRGLAVINAPAIDRINGIDEAITVATVPPYTLLGAGQMVATVKLITFGIAASRVDAAVAAADSPPVRVAALRPRSVGLLQTRLPGVKESVLDKTVETTRDRLRALGSELVAERRCGHTSSEVAAVLRSLRDEGCEIVLALGASAITDRRDVLPIAVEQAGGRIEHFGMPVDPGNLMLFARLADGVPVLGLPGSGRSPRLHGFDWVLQRLLADLPLTGADLTAMGVGGLLKDIPGRPLPRADATRPARRAAASPTPVSKVAAIVLAAGQSRRMGSINKLLAEIDGVPMVARTVDAALASRADPVLVVTGHEAEQVRDALGCRPVIYIHNEDYEAGLSSSLKKGVSALPGGIDGVLVCLGDMPRLSGDHLDRLIAAFHPDRGRTICVPTVRGKRGNPVLWAARFFDEMRALSGDVGARHLIGEHADEVVEVPFEDDGVLIDVDSPEALEALKRPATTPA